MLNHEVFWHALTEGTSSPISKADMNMLMGFADDFAKRGGWTAETEAEYREKYKDRKNLDALIDSEKLGRYMQSEEFRNLSADSPIMSVIHKVMMWIKTHLGFDVTVKDAQRILANAYQGFVNGENYYSAPENEAKLEVAGKIASAKSESKIVGILADYYSKKLGTKIDKDFVTARLDKFYRIFGQDAKYADVFERGGMSFRWKLELILAMMEGRYDLATGM